jgi:hypothetical protein
MRSLSATCSMSAAKSHASVPTLDIGAQVTSAGLPVEAVSAIWPRSAMKCAILQPSYVPWRGYFHQIQKVDVFVFYDDVQYDKHGWRNRNRIKTEQGPAWLTIPVKSKGNVTRGIPINRIEMAQPSTWNVAHLARIQQAYQRAPHYLRYLDVARALLADPPLLLADFTISATILLAHELGIRNTRFIRSSELAIGGEKTDRLVEILRALGAQHYLSGPSARNYLEEEKLSASGVSLEYMTYDYPEYPQLHPPFDPQVSVLDLLFQVGPEAGRYIWGPEA